MGTLISRYWVFFNFRFLLNCEIGHRCLMCTFVPLAWLAQVHRHSGAGRGGPLVRVSCRCPLWSQCPASPALIQTLTGETILKVVPTVSKQTSLHVRESRRGLRSPVSTWLLNTIPDFADLSEDFVCLPPELGASASGLFCSSLSSTRGGASLPG